MKKSTIYSAMILMLFTVLALGSLQWFWVTSFFDVQKDNLDQNIRRILTTTTEKYLKSALNLEKKFGLDSLENAEVLISAVKITDSIDLFRKGKTQIKIQRDFQYYDEDTLYTNTPKPRVITPIEKPLHEDFSFNKVEKANLILIDSLLKIETLKAGINSNYLLGIWNRRTNTMDQFTTGSNEIHNLNNIYKVPLFGFNMDADDYLLVHFPDKNAEVLKKMKFVLIGSVLLMLFVIGCFVYALNIILRQKKLSEIKNDFINNMTHEFKTPISTISLATEALLNFNVLEDKDKAVKYLNISKNESNRLGLMVEKVLKLAAYEKQKISLNIERIDIHELINQIKNNINVQIEEKGGSLTTNLSAKSSLIEADQVHLSNVIYNLIDNANKYSKGKPKILVSTEDEGSQLKISVKDNGIGISNSQIKKVFDKFYRVPTGNIHNVKGFGLGLSYVAEIINRHFGSIKVESEQNVGSAFHIYLPQTHG